MNAVADPSTLRRLAADACPGRTAALIEARVQQLLGAPCTVDAALADVARTRQGTTPAEHAVLDAVEVFVADVHAVDDELFAAVAHHLGPADTVAVFMHAGLCDGFARWSLAEVH